MNKLCLVIFIAYIFSSDVLIERAEIVALNAYQEKSDIRQDIQEKIRKELNDSLSKENILYEEDKILLYKLYQKLIKEFQDLDKSKL